ncbi:DUF6994 family protein [Paraliobacillus quinghaiensis]
MNYFKDVNPNWIDESFDLRKREDPDAKSKKLYEDLVKWLLDKKELPNGNIIKVEDEVVWIDKYGTYEVRIEILNGGKSLYRVGLGSDYIGASVYWAIKAKIGKEEIVDFLKISRTIGGHMFFPRWIKDYTTTNNEFHHSLSINKAKGGRNDFYDRFDLFLFDLNSWYLGKESKLKDVYDKNKIWLNQFETFPQFISFFKLDGFTNGNKNENKILIKNLLTFNPEKKIIAYLDNNNSTIPTEKVAYIDYARHSNSVILLRNNK